MSRPRLRPPTDTKFEALALLFGPPDPRWKRISSIMWFGVADINNKRFRACVYKLFDEQEVVRVGLNRIARDYAEWYEVQEKAHVTPDV